jgi:hypothetical protein
MHVLDAMFAAPVLALAAIRLFAVHLINATP